MSDTPETPLMTPDTEAKIMKFARLAVDATMIMAICTVEGVALSIEGLREEYVTPEHSVTIRAEEIVGFEETYDDPKEQLRLMARVLLAVFERALHPIDPRVNRSEIYLIDDNGDACVRTSADLLDWLKIPIADVLRPDPDHQDGYDDVEAIIFPITSLPRD